MNQQQMQRILRNEMGGGASKYHIFKLHCRTKKPAQETITEKDQSHGAIEDPSDKQNRPCKHLPYLNIPVISSKMI